MKSLTGPLCPLLIIHTTRAMVVFYRDRSTGHAILLEMEIWLETKGTADIGTSAYLANMHHHQRFLGGILFHHTLHSFGGSGERLLWYRTEA